MFQVVDWAGWRCKMEHEIHGPGNKNELRYILPDQSKIRIPGEMFDIIRRTGNEIVNCNNTEPLAQQAITKMRTQESRTPSNDGSLIRQFRSEHGSYFTAPECLQSKTERY